MSQLLFILSFFSLTIFFQVESSYKLHDLRQLLEKGAKDKDTCEKLLKHLEQYNGKDPVVYGVKAATQGLMAKHAWSPYYKLKHLRTSADLFEEVIKKHPGVAEVHFLRFTIESYIPKYLQMSQNQLADKRVFLNSMIKYPDSDIDEEVLVIMRKFLLRHPDLLTEAEKKQISNIKT